MNNDIEEIDEGLLKLYKELKGDIKKDTPRFISVDGLVNYLVGEIEALEKAADMLKNTDKILHAICLGRIAEAGTILDWVR